MNSRLLNILETHEQEDKLALSERLEATLKEQFSDADGLLGRLKTDGALRCYTEHQLSVNQALVRVAAEIRARLYI